MRKVIIKGEKEPRMVTTRYYERLRDEGLAVLFEEKEEKITVETKEDKKATRRKTK